ncbi:MAG: class A beta-lactamase-related serine hydrolase [Thermoanaerobaculia bacterium]|nr:class A beta-lactamase-related serine hydrolase [Thermoanaerobaculia bacterium]
MNKLFAALGLIACLAGCKPAAFIAGKKAVNPLEKILASHATDFDSILSRPGVYEVQIIYTQIDRDKNQAPHFTSWHWNVDSSRYFYPASIVKMPLALLALEKINDLRRSGYPALTKDTSYRIDSLRPYQRNYSADTSAPGNRPGIAHDIRRIFTVSDNLSYNHLFEFLGRAYINQALQAKGYTRTGIVRRFYAGGRDNAYTSPITFLDAAGHTRWKQAELHDKRQWVNPQTHLQKGRGYIDNRDNLVNAPFDFSNQNWFALTDMEKMLRAVIFPDAVPEQNRFDLTPEDYRFLYRYMGIFPRECDYPRYDTAHYWDSYVKFFLFGDTKDRRDGSVRVFNKVGVAYGTVTDIAYIADFHQNVEFILAATILCNRDGVFNDDKYEYETVGYPFLAKLGRAVHEYELKRKRRVRPDLNALRITTETK